MSRVAARRFPRLGAVAASVAVVAVTATVVTTAIEHGVGRGAPPSQELISIDPGGTKAAAGAAREPSVSGDGTLVVYTSTPANGLPTVFVRDRVAKTTTPVPLPLGATREDHAVLSADGCHVVFWALGAPAAGGAATQSLFTLNRCTAGAVPTVIPTSATLGLTATALIARPALSRDGRFVAYAASLARGTPWRIALFDTTTGTEQLAAPITAVVTLTTVDVAGDGSTVVFDAGPDPAAPPTTVIAWNPAATPASAALRTVSVGPSGAPAGGINAMPSISGDGRVVAFVSNSPDLVGISGGTLQLYARDLGSGTVSLVTATPGAAQPGNVLQPDLTADGSQVAFTTQPAGAPVTLAVPVVGPSSVAVARSTSAVFAAAAVETISTTTTGATAPGTSSAPVLSTTGRFTAYESDAGTALSGGQFPAGIQVWMAQRTPALSVAATTDLGTVDVGSPSANTLVHVTNPSDVGISVGQVAAPGNGFALVADTCSNTVVPAGGTCAITVVFTPSTAGATSAQLTIAGEGQTATTTLQGSGRVQRRALSVDDGNIEFPSTATGTRGGPSTVTVRDTGDLPVAIAGVALEGAAADQFSILGNGCAGQTLTPNATCQVTVVALPSAPGTLQATLAVTGSNGESTSATLNVIAFTSTVATTTTTTTTRPPPTTLAPGVLVAKPATLAFATTAIGAQSTPSTVTVSNSGGSGVSITTATITGGDGQFSIVTDTCASAQLGAGHSCSVAIVVHPTQGGTITASLTVRGSRGESTIVALTAPSTFAPSLTVVPRIVRSGDLTTVRGANFPPGRPVVVQLSRPGGGGMLPFATATTGADGGFTVAVVVARQGLGTGPWEVVVVDQPDFSAVSAPLLVDRSGPAPGGATAAAGIGGIPRLGPQLPRAP